MKSFRAFYIFFIICGLIACATAAHARTMGPLPEFTKEDRVLVMAPHPDDEAIGTGGVIRRALKAGASVRVVLMTNGENNELSFIVYKKRPVLTRRELLSMGEIRRQESGKGLSVLGVPEKDIISLGYPDFGTMDILTRFWGETKPFRSMLSRVRYVPYENVVSPQAPFVGESILADLKRIMLDYQPTKIFVSHPADTNRDHRACYLFTKLALWDLEGRIQTPEIYPYLIHVAGWPKPRGYYKDIVLAAPNDLMGSKIAWSYLNLTDDEVEAKRDAIRQYVSQNKYAPRYLLTFARRNELFGDYPDTVLRKQMASEIDWTVVANGDENLPKGKSSQAEHISGLAFARQGNTLLVRLGLRQEIQKDIGLTVQLLGYSTEKSFSEMPKLSLQVILGSLMVKDKNTKLPNKDIQFTMNDRDVIFRIPLSMLGNPDRVLSMARTSVYNLTLDETAWRVLRFAEDKP